MQALLHGYGLMDIIEGVLNPNSVPNFSSLEFMGSTCSILMIMSTHSSECHKCDTLLSLNSELNDYSLLDDETFCVLVLSRGSQIGA
jgi:hypothetical protein